ncbi:SNF2 family N-terminal domain-containing protein [Lentinula boryana]|uniref:SNF2 family N-terminal domain-containing protein n=1 Tax=Lentinula boryana TaxID=40481 RepID=A0ABQ8QQ98_9AGAR|nr:SNF2 family N-terminal domain-containing protein [Lentinula boryana]
MAPTTRRAARNQTPATSTNTNTNTNSNNSPFLSTNASVAEEESPETTPEVEQEPVPVLTKRTNTRSQSHKGKKRPASASLHSEDEDEDEDGQSRQASKRRVISKNMYVEVAVVSKKRNVTGIKGKDKEIKSKSMGIAKGKAKAKAKAPPSANSESDSEPGLDYDETKSITDSGSSGSEFIASEDDDEDEDEDDVYQESDNNRLSKPTTTKKRRVAPVRNPVRLSPVEVSSEDEDGDGDAIMLEAAIQLSRRANRGMDTLGAGPSSSVNANANVRADASRIAAAIERRLYERVRTGVNVDVNDDDDSVAGFDNLSPLSDGSEEEEEEEETVAEKSKGKKGKGNKKPKSKSKSEPKTKPKQRKADLAKSPEEMTKTEFRRARREVKRKERELRYKLGRKLTHAERTTIALHKHHPELIDVWGDLKANIQIIKTVESQQPAGIKLTLLPFQRESLHWMRKQEEGPWKGGMLADEMGMGKTIQVIALLVSDRKKPNLIIAPTVAIMQWRNEIEAHTDGMKVLVWHGQSRESDVKELKKHDVVLTTYAILESCFRKQESGFKRKEKMIKEKSPIHQILWNRVVLDEAHNIKDRASNTAKASFELQAVSRWCLSGTPLQNRVGELYSLIRFLGGDPFSYYYCKQCSCKSLYWKFTDKRSCDDCGHSPMQHTCFWNNEILTPIQRDGMDGPGKIAFKKLKILLDRMMLRRTKLQRADDLGLPPRTVIVRNDYFSPEEKELYLSLFSDAKRQFGTYLDQGTILNNYSNIFSLLTRMRQMACHPDLVIRSKSNANKFITENLSEATVCRICNDIAEDAIQSKCRHIFDRECIKQYLNTAIEQNPSCPVCFVPLTIDLEAPALDLEVDTSNARQGILGRLNLDSWKSSTKIEALVEELSNLRNQDATTKSIVFSQFVNFLDLIAYRLQKAGFTICRLEGTMSPQARDATIKHFMNNVEVTVFLVSLKAGGVALNLTEASRVYLMDSWWNPAVEFQAMDRIHRLGQHRPVKAIKLVVEDSIESRIVQLQEKKSAMVDATLSPDDSAMGRLTPEDLQFLFRL